MIKVIFFAFILWSVLILPLLIAAHDSTSSSRRPKIANNLLVNQDNRLQDRASSLLHIDFNYENCSNKLFADSAGLFNNFRSICQVEVPVYTNSTALSSDFQSCCLSSNGVWNKFTQVISTFEQQHRPNRTTGAVSETETSQEKLFWNKFSSRLVQNTTSIESTTKFSVYFWVTPPYVPSSNGSYTENNEIFSLGYCKSCGYNFKVSLVSGIHNSSLTASGGGQFYNRLRLEICLLTAKTKKLIGAELSSINFTISSKILQDRKAVLATVSVKNIIVYFPPFFQLYQLQAQFFVVHSISSSTDQFEIYNSTAYYFSTESLLDISTWGSTVVNISDSQSGVINSYSSFANILSLSSVSKPTFQTSLDKNSLTSSFCNTPITFRHKANGNIETFPFNAICGLTLYSLRIINVVDFSFNEWKYLLFNDFPQTSIVAVESTEFIPEVGMKNSVDNCFHDPYSYERLPKSSDLPRIDAVILVWVPSYQEVFMKTKRQVGMYQLNVVVDRLNENLHENCSKKSVARLQDLVFFSNSSEMQSSCSEIYFENGTSIRLPYSSAVFAKNIPFSNSSIVTFPFLYRPPFGQFSIPLSSAIDSLHFRAQWTTDGETIQISNGRVDVIVKEILKPVRPFPLTQYFQTASQVVSILRIDFVKEHHHSLSKIEFVELPVLSSFYCLPQTLLEELNKNSTLYLSLHANATLLRALAANERSISGNRRYCIVDNGTSNNTYGNFSYDLVSTYVAFLSYGNGNMTQFSNVTNEANRTASFILHSADNSSSIKGTLSIRVLPSVQIQTEKIKRNMTSNSISLRTNAYGKADLNVFAHDVATFSSRFLIIEILKQPRFGTMTHKPNSTELVVPPYDTPIQFQYKFNTSFHYFSFPTTTARGLPLTRAGCRYLSGDTISLRAVSVDTMDHSLPLNIPIELKNFNDPTMISIISSSQKEHQLLGEDGSTLPSKTVPVTHMDKKIFAYSGTRKELLVENMTLLSFAYENWQVHDPDCDISLVRVRINTTRKSCRLTLTDKAISLVDFNSQEYCFHKSLQLPCHGDGLDDKDMVFVVAPSDLPQVLRGLTYYSYSPNMKDVISIHIYDGEGPDCFYKSSLDAATIYNGCFLSSFQISVTVGSWRNLQNGGNKGSLFDSGSWTVNSILTSTTRLQYAAAVIGIILVILLCVFRICIRRCSNHRRAEKKMNVASSMDSAPDNNKRSHFLKAKKPKKSFLRSEERDSFLGRSPKSTPTRSPSRIMKEEVPRSSTFESQYRQETNESIPSNYFPHPSIRSKRPSRSSNSSPRSPTHRSKKNMKSNLKESSPYPTGLKHTADDDFYFYDLNC